MAKEKPSCFYNKDLGLILKIEDNDKFLLVDITVLLGTKYLLSEKGYIKKNNHDVTFVITSLASFEADSIDLTRIEDLSSKPLSVYGKLNSKGVYLESKGASLKECSCKKNIFHVLDELKDF